MKKIKNILTAAILTAGGFLAGCTSVADELTELSLTRCLEPLNLEYTISNGDSVIFNWDLVSGSDQFALQIAENDGTFETEDGKLTSAVIKDLIVTADKVPYGIKLTADQKYFFRVQAQTSANDKEPSKWAVSADTISTYAVRSSLFPEVTGRTATSITLSWNEDPDVTHILCTPREGTPVRYDLSEDEVKAHTATVSNMTASTNYTVGLYYMSANRGELSLYTMPAFDGTEAVVSDLAGLQAAFADKAPKVRLTMAGSPYDLGSVDLTGDMEIYGEEAADGTRPVILGSVSIAGAETIGRFLSQGIEWNGNDGSTGRHVQMKSGNITDVTYRNCTITVYSDGLFYNNVGGTVSSVTYEGCDIYDIPGSGGDGIDIRKGELGNLNFINNTVYNGLRTFLRIDADVTVTGKLTVRNNTFMGISTAIEGSNNRGFLGIRTETASGKVEIASNIFLHMTGFSTMISTSAQNLAGTSYSFSNNHFFDVAEEFFNDKCAEATAIAGGGSVLAADPCFNSAGMNFHLTNSSMLNAKVGDPRWFVAYVEPPIDNNLTLITGAKTWDLTDASIFSGSIKTTQVKDQLRIIADDAHEVILADSLVFTAAADISRAGIPNAGALEFLVDKPGSLVIETLDYDGNTGNHIVVSLNGTVKGGVATNSDMRGTSQKIVIEGIEEQSSIYLYPSGPIAITTLSWSNDVSPVNTALQTPEVTATPNSVGETAEPVTVTWNAVPGAASYSFSFGSISTEVTGTEYTIPADAFSVLGSGGYPVTVIANPAEGDIYNTASSAGTATISVVKGGSGTPVVSTLDEAFEYLQAGQPVQLAAGTYTFAGSGINGMSEDGVYTITNNFDLSAEEGAEVIIIGGFKFGAGAANVSLNGIKFSGNDEKIGNFLEDVNEDIITESVSVTNCEITGYNKSIIYKSQAASTIKEIEFSNNYIHDMGTKQGSFDFRKGTIASLTVQNNVIANGSRDMVRADDGVTGANSIIISNNTFYNITGGNSNGFARIRATVTDGITISKNVFVKMQSSNYPFVHSDTMSTNTVKVEVDHNFFFDYHNDWFSDMGQTEATANGGAVLTADPIPNAASGDFSVTGEAATAGAGATWPK
ncbi:MAG TPA: DUF4957 domain-containing protein [Candidatus Coprenecus stercorigallinarum]|nr:DUF4957 domain-containing protein [Candidatus Coprenecus stercorigallinarum]